MKHSVFSSTWLGTMGICLFAFSIMGCTHQKSNPANNTSADSVSQTDTSAVDTTHIAPTSSTESLPDVSAKAANQRSEETQVNSYYDKGYKQGYEDGFEDGVENSRFQTYDDACDVTTHSKVLDYKSGYQEGYDAGYDDGFADSDIKPNDDFEE